MKIGIISITGAQAIGARYMFSALEKDGHTCHLIHVKVVKSKIMNRLETDNEAIIKDNKLEGQNAGYLMRYYWKGNLFSPCPEIIKEEDIALLIQLIKEEKYDYLCFSLLMANQENAEIITTRLKETFPDIPIAWGGLYPTFSPEESIHFADVVVVGEGEHCFCQYLREPNRTDIQGVWVKKDQDIYRNGVAKPIEDLDTLPFPTFMKNEIRIDYGYIDREVYLQPEYAKDMYLMITSRDCYFKCSYCVQHQKHKLYGGNIYRRRSVEHVIQELEKAVKMYEGHLDYIMMYDAIFACDMEWIREFCIEYKKRIHLPFYCFGHHACTTIEMLKLLRKAGLVTIRNGIQTGSKELQEKVYNRKHYSVEFYKNYYTAVLEEADYKMYMVDVIIGAHDNEKSLRDTLEVLLELPKPYNLQLFRLSAVPFTKIAEKEIEDPLSLTEEYFWAVLYQLCQFSEISRESILTLSHDEYLKKHPKVLDEMLSALADLYPDMQVFYGMNRELISYKNYHPYVDPEFLKKRADCSIMKKIFRNIVPERIRLKIKKKVLSVYNAAPA